MVGLPGSGGGPGMVQLLTGHGHLVGGGVLSRRRI